MQWSKFMKAEIVWLFISTAFFLIYTIILLIGCDDKKKLMDGLKAGLITVFKSDVFITIVLFLITVFVAVISGGLL